MDRTLNDIELLKIGLFTHGMKVSENARKSIEGHEKRPLTLADYASTSGISLELEDNIWVNAPIVDYNPNFVSETPYILDFIGGDFFVRSPCLEVKVKPIPVSDYHNRTNVKGEKYTKLSENISSLSFSSNTASILNFKSGLFINQSCHKDLQAGRIQILVYLGLDFLYFFEPLVACDKFCALCCKSSSEMNTIKVSELLLCLHVAIACAQQACVLCYLSGNRNYFQVRQGLDIKKDFLCLFATLAATKVKTELCQLNGRNNTANFFCFFYVLNGFC